jgi:plastocyanin
MNNDSSPLPKGNRLKTSGAVAFAVLLIFGTVVGAMTFAQKNAFAAVNIATSSTQIFGADMVRVLVTDTSINTAGQTISVEVDAKRGSSTLGTITPTINQIGTTGTFEFYITTSDCPVTPANPTNPGTSDGTSAAVVRANPHATAINCGVTTTKPLLTSTVMQDGDSFVITYGGQTVTVSYSHSIATLSTDRTTAGTNNHILVQLMDQDANVDPTAIDSFPASATFLSTTGGTLNIGTALFRETGQNTGQFQLVVNVTSAAPTASSSTQPGAASLSATLPTAVSFKSTDQDLYNTTLIGHGVKAVTTNTDTTGTFVSTGSTSSSSATVTLQNVDAALALNAPVSIPNGFKLQVTDPDQNLDTQTRDVLPAGSVAISASFANGSPIPGAGGSVSDILTQNITTTATGSNGRMNMTQTIVFTADPGPGVSASATPSSNVTAVSAGSAITTITQSGATRTVTVSIPISSTTAGGAKISATVIVSTPQAATISSANAVNPTPLSSGATITLTGSESLTSLSSTSVGNTGAATTGIPFRETGLSTGIFLPDNSRNTIPINVVPVGQDAITPTSINLSPVTIAQGPTITVTYTDPFGTNNVVNKAFSLSPSITTAVGSITAPSTVTVSSKFNLTITDSDLSLDPTTTSSYVVTFSGGQNTSPSVTNTSPGPASMQLGNGLNTLTFKIRGSAATVPTGTTLTMTFIETSPGSGVFVANNIDMNILNTIAAANGGPLADGDQIAFKLYDNDQNPSSSSTATITVSKPSTAITVDRATIPIPTPGGETSQVAPVPSFGPVKFTITITDATVNTNPNSVDTLNFPGITGSALATGTSGVTLTLSNGQIVSNPSTLITGLGPVGYTETGLNTGVFSNTYSLAPNATATLSQLATLNNARLNFQYASGATTVTQSVLLKSYDGVVSLSESTIKNGDTLKITVTDQDLNRDPSSASQATVTLRMVGQPADLPSTVTFTDVTETAPGSGVFTKTVVVGKDFRITDPSGQSATTVETHYTDELASDGSQLQDREIDMNVGFGQGTLSITPTQVGPGAKLIIAVNDPNLNSNPTGQLTVPTAGSGVQYLRITSNRTGANVMSNGIQGLETTAGSGIFLTTLQLHPIPVTGVGTSCPTSGVGAGCFDTTQTGYNLTGYVLPGDILSISYTQQHNAQGVKQVISQNVQVRSWDPVFNASSSTIAPGDTVTLNITDPDRITDPTTIDTVALRATSDSDPVGTSITAIETAPGSGVFTASIPTTTTVSSGAVSVKTGDTLSVKYTDPYPADYSSRVNTVSNPQKDFYFTIPVGTSTGPNGGINTTTPQTPQAQTLTGQPLSSIHVGDQPNFVTRVQNNGNTQLQFTAIITITDSNGITLANIIASGSVAPNSLSGAVGGSYTFDTPGTYTVKTFIVSDLNNPVVLSTPTQADFTVS